MFADDLAVKSPMEAMHQALEMADHTISNEGLEMSLMNIKVMVLGSLQAPTDFQLAHRTVEVVPYFD